MIKKTLAAALLCTPLLQADHYTVVADWVYWKRHGIHDHCYVDDANKFQCHSACPNFCVYDTRRLTNEFSFEPGIRIDAQYHLGSKSTFEANYVWLEEWSAEHENQDAGSMSFPFTDSNYTFDYINADKAHAIYHSQFWEAELNYWYHMSPRKLNYVSFSTILGLRYIDMWEGFKLTFAKMNDKSHYIIHTNNNLYGAQIGADFQMNPTARLSWDFFIKLGAAANHAKQHTHLGDQDDSVILRDFKNSHIRPAYFIDLSALMSYSFWDAFEVHGGYQMLYLTGMAFASEQLDDKVGPDNGKRLYHKGQCFIHGAFAGLSLNF